MGLLDDPGVARFAYWRITESDVHRFDLWVVAVDAGIVFEADSATRTPINVIQGSCQSSDDAPAWQRNCEDLATTAPSTLWF